jgi:hypothetical protein
LTLLPSLLLSTPVIPSTVGSGKNSLEHYRPKVGGPSHSLFSPTHTCSLSSPLTPTASSVIGSACKISPPPRQGKDRLVQKFRNSTVMLEAEHYRPKVSDFRRIVLVFANIYSFSSLFTPPLLGDKDPLLRKYSSNRSSWLAGPDN